jgi:hypothetical protein
MLLLLLFFVDVTVVESPAPVSIYVPAARYLGEGLTRQYLIYLQRSNTSAIIDLTNMQREHDLCCTVNLAEFFKRP